MTLFSTEPYRASEIAETAEDEEYRNEVIDAYFWLKGKDSPQPANTWETRFFNYNNDFLHVVELTNTNGHLATLASPEAGLWYLLEGTIEDNWIELTKSESAEVT